MLGNLILMGNMEDVDEILEANAHHSNDMQGSFCLVLSALVLSRSDRTTHDMEMKSPLPRPLL